MNFWNQLFTEAFDAVKNSIQQNYQRDDSQTILPNEQAILIGSSKLPCKVEIIDVDCSNVNNLEIDDICQLIKFDLTTLGKLDVTYHGAVLFDKATVYESIKTKFKEDDEHSKFIAKSLVDTPGQYGFPQNNDTYIEFTAYDIRKNTKKFQDDLKSKFYSSFDDYFIRTFKTKTELDFNSLYNLTSDPILSPNELLKPDSRTNITLEHLQSAIADIQLIPDIPEPVKVEFQHAKDLFVFSFFKYEFATLSDRSAHFAFETAMKMRYVKSLNGKAIISYKSKVIHELTNPTYSGISEHLYTMRNKLSRNFNDLQVNNKNFPFTVKELMNWLIENGSPKWKFRLYDASRQLRNSFAHPEDVIILSPSINTLQRIAYDINEMFSDLK